MVWKPPTERIFSQNESKLLAEHFRGKGLPIPNAMIFWRLTPIGACNYLQRKYKHSCTPSELVRAAGRSFVESPETELEQ